jgi:hypothetical protein
MLNAQMIQDFADRAANTNDKAEIFGAFEPVFQDTRAKRDELITRTVVLTYRAMWRKKAWVGGGYKSANSMFRVLLGISPDGKLSKEDKERVKAEVNFSHYVRNNSPAALALSGKKRGGKGSPVTLESFAAYVEKATTAVKVSDRNGLTAADLILAQVRNWYDAQVEAVSVAKAA